jgi:hypothetical protein
MGKDMAMLRQARLRKLQTRAQTRAIQISNFSLRPPREERTPNVTASRSRYNNIPPTRILRSVVRRKKMGKKKGHGGGESSPVSSDGELVQASVTIPLGGGDDDGDDDDDDNNAIAVQSDREIEIMKDINLEEGHDRNEEGLPILAKNMSNSVIKDVQSVDMFPKEPFNEPTMDQFASFEHLSFSYEDQPYNYIPFIPISPSTDNNGIYNPFDIDFNTK